MVELLLPLLLKFLPYIIAVVGVLAVYFGIKRKGVSEERERQELRRLEEVKATQQAVNEASLKDSDIDKKVKDAVSKIQEKPKSDPIVPGSQFKF